MSYYENLISDKIDAGLHYQEQYYNSLNMINRQTPDNITSLKEGEVVVVGTNEEGRHGKGAALFAKLYAGAIQGQARGLMGQTYGIVTKKNWRVEKSSTLEEIQGEVNTFIEFAYNHPELIFKVTKLGCSLAGYTVQEIAPLFRRALHIKNIHLPAEFWDELLKSAPITQSDINWAMKMVNDSDFVLSVSRKEPSKNDNPKISK